MSSITPNPKKRSYLLPPGCKDLVDLLNGPPAKPSLGPRARINDQIRAPELRVIGEDGRQLGILPLTEALALAKAQGIDLVEVGPHAKPPVCRLVDFEKLRREAEKRRKKKKNP